ncbi:MAG: hypothetical protein WDN46_05730 [Methylocella sp.]
MIGDFHLSVDLMALDSLSSNGSIVDVRRAHHVHVCVAAIQFEALIAQCGATGKT